MTIKLTEEQKIRLLNTDDIFGIMQEILLREDKIDQEKEHFWMIGLTFNNRIQYIELVSLGSVSSATVEPMNVFRIAVMKGSVKVIMIHNHPSGELSPSDRDKELTDRLLQVGIILNIPVIDHLIITPKSFFSFSDTGVLDMLAKSLKYVPPFALIEKIRDEEKKIRSEAVKAAAQKNLEKGIKQGFKDGVQQEKIEFARVMIRAEEPVEKIMQYTGLSRLELEQLSGEG